MNSRKLYPLYFPVVKRCCICQSSTFASTVTIVPGQRDRQRYFCPDCATQQGFPPSKYLSQRIAQQQGQRLNLPQRRLLKH